MATNEQAYIAKVNELLTLWDDFDFTESARCQIYGEKVSGDHWLAMSLMEVNAAYLRAERHNETIEWGPCK